MRHAVPPRIGVGAAVIAAAALGLLVAGCAETQLATHIASAGHGDSSVRYKVGSPYAIDGRTYTPEEDFYYDREGIASWYGPGFHGRRTANGEIYDQNALTAAHPTLQMPAMVRVTNLENGRSVDLRINDRGPFVGDRIIDVSRRSAELLGFRGQGTARVRVQVMTDESLALAEARGRRGDDPAPQRTAVAAAPQLPVPERRPPASSATVAAQSGSSRSSQAPSTAPRTVSTPRGPVAAPAGVSTPVTLVDASAYPAPTPQTPPHPEPAATPPLATDMPLSEAQLFVQVGAFRGYANAQRLQERLETLAPADISTVMVDGTQFHRVRLGPFATVGDAEDVLAQLADGESQRAHIVNADTVMANTVIQ